MKNAYQPKSRQNELVVQELGNELLIYDLQTHKAVCLNETSARVWNLCAVGERTVADISRRMSKELKTPIAEDFIWLALDKLREKVCWRRTATAKKKRRILYERNLTGCRGVKRFAKSAWLR